MIFFGGRRIGAEAWLLPCQHHQEDIPLCSYVQCFPSYTELYTCIISGLSVMVDTERPRHPGPIVVGALSLDTTKQLYQGCDLESAFPRPPLSQWLREPCPSSLEIMGKIWISELFNLVAKFSPMLHRPRQICLEWFLLLPATRVIDLKDIRYTSKWKTTS